MVNKEYKVDKFRVEENKVIMKLILITQKILAEIKK